MPIEADDLQTAVTLESQRTGIIEEPPFKLLALGNWSGDAEKKELGSRRVIEIDRDNFDETIAKLGVRLELEYEGGTLSLEFADLDDFHPDQIFRRVALFSELRDLRKRLRDENTFNAAAREVRDRFGIERTAAEEPVAAEEEEQAAGGLLDAILTRPSGGAPKPKPGMSKDIADLVNDIVRPHLVSLDENEQSQMILAVDAAISGLMRGILHDARFQELEAAWRGLFFLVRRTETSPDLKIFITDISKSELSDELRSAESLASTSLYRHLIKDAIETPGGEGYAAVLGNYAFDINVDDVAALIRVAKLAAGANAPFIANATPSVLGLETLDGNADPGNWDLSDETQTAKLWAALRGQPEAEYLGLTMPRLLTRLPYGVDTDPLETFAFEEFDGLPAHDGYVWTNGCFAVGQLIAETYSAYGWDMGRALKQDIEGLPVHVYKESTETVYKPCSEVLLTDKAFQKLMEIGVMPFITYKNSDRVKLARYQSVADTALKGPWN